MSETIIAAVIGFIAAILSSCAPSLMVGSSWRSSVEKELDLFYKLFPLSDSVYDDETIEMLRQSIFQKARKGLLGIDRRIKIGIEYFVVYMIIVLVCSLCTGRYSDHPLFILLDLISGIVCSLLYLGVGVLLAHYPKKKWNYLFVKEERRKEEMELIWKAREVLEKGRVDTGRHSNYFWYKEHRHTEWNPSPDDKDKEKAAVQESDFSDTDTL